MAVTYGYLCEDKALELFVEETLIRLGPKSKCKVFEKNVEFCDRFKAISGRGRNEIIARYAEAAKIAISEKKLNLFIAAYDFDHFKTDGYESTLKKQIDELSIKTRNKSVMCVPVQCVEYWFWYVKHASDISAPINNFLEANSEFNRHFIKSDVYERALDEKGKYPGQSAATELAKARIILEKFDLDKLESLSPSFAHFVAQIKRFCNT